MNIMFLWYLDLMWDINFALCFVDCPLFCYSNHNISPHIFAALTYYGRNFKMMILSYTPWIIHPVSETLIFEQLFKVRRLLSILDILRWLLLFLLLLLTHERRLEADIYNSCHGCKIILVKKMVDILSSIIEVEEPIVNLYKNQTLFS